MGLGGELPAKIMVRSPGQWFHLRWLGLIAGTGRSVAEALQATQSKLKRLLLSPHITADAECVIDGSGPKGLIWLC